MDCYITDFKIAVTAGAVALEDSIMRKESLTTAGSKALANFTAPFSAEVVNRLLDAHMSISGKTQMNEFGLGVVTGGNLKNMSGSVKAVKEGSAAYCLCNDLFGIYRREAAENGLSYIHPTYGTVSRYGLIPLASSMDRIGVMCKDLTDGFSLLSLIAGYDPKDGAMYKDLRYTYGNTGKIVRVLAPSRIIKQASEPDQNAIRAFLENFESVDDDIDYFDVYKQVMYILSCAEISNNINRYDGIKFGYRSPKARNLESLYLKTRTEAFEIETKLTAIMGAMVLSAECYVPYYEKAMRIRRLIKNSLSFDNYDIIVLPSAISQKPYENLSLYAASALAGLPSVSFLYNGRGIQLIANTKGENALLTAWEAVR